MRLLRADRKDCSVQLLVDGRAQQVGKPVQRLVQGYDEISVETSPQLLADLSKAARAAGEACDLKFVFDAPSKSLIQEFLTAFAHKLDPAAPAHAGIGAPATEQR